MVWKSKFSTYDIAFFAMCCLKWSEQTFYKWH